jgi:hypothetical protein
VRIDGLDQSVPGGKFMWLHKANAGCAAWQSDEREDHFEGWHDGYARLADPVMHCRTIHFDKRARLFVIEDALSMRGEHEVELFFHFDERCRVSADVDGCIAERDHLRLGLRTPEVAGAEIQILSGSVDPVCGWVSRRFDERVPSPTLRWRARIAGDCVLKTLIAISPCNPIS